MALALALARRNPFPGFIVHADRGTQHASSAHQALLAKHGLVGSMSRKGNCRDNAVMACFFLSLKMKRVWQKGYANAWMVLGAAPAGLLIGYFIDREAGTTPWFMLGLSMLFLATSLYRLVKDSGK